MTAAEAAERHARREHQVRQLDRLASLYFEAAGALKTLPIHAPDFERRYVEALGPVASAEAAIGLRVADAIADLPVPEGVSL